MLTTSGKSLRDFERRLHLALGVALLLLAFTPLGTGDVGALLRAAVAPLLVISGLLMWQHARVTKALRSGRYPVRIE